MIATTQCLLDCVVEEERIEQNTTWQSSNFPNGEKIIDGILTIESGYTLTIENGVTVRFGQGSRLIIKPGCKLFLHGILTSNDCRNIWKGIEVWGNASKSQFLNPGNKYEQGFFISYSTAIVENAETAVQLWGPTLNGGQAGGMISCNGTAFLNNQTGIDFAPYKNFHPSTNQPATYAAWLTGCHFETNQDYPHYKPFFAFVKMEGVNGPQFIGCSFENSQTPALIPGITSYGFGIRAIDAGFQVLPKCLSNPAPCTQFQRSEFRGLGYGIYTGNTGILSPVGAPYTVQQADFYDCYIGIQNRLVTGGTILFNHFYMGNPPSTAVTSDQIGIALTNNISGFIIEENTFQKNAGQEVTAVGISALNTGNINKVIRRNTFNGVAVSNEAGGVNGNFNFPVRGLYYDCNFNSNTTEYDFVICDAVQGADNVRSAQGLEINNQPPLYNASGNKFSYSGIPQDRDFSNQGGSNINYYYYEPGTNEEPLSFTMIFKIEANENDCPVNYCDPPCHQTEDVSLLKSNYYARRSGYQTAKTGHDAATTEGDTLLAAQKAIEAAFYRRGMDESAYKVVQHSMHDTVQFHRDTLRSWVRNLDTYGAEIMVATDYFAEGDSSTAFAMLDSLPYKFQLSAEQINDVANVDTIFQLLAGQGIYVLDGYRQNTLLRIAVREGEYAPGLAKNILVLYGHDFPPVVCLHQSTDPEQSIGHVKGHQVKMSEKILSVFPNPASDIVTFTLALPEVEGATTALLITDLMGKVIEYNTLLTLKNPSFIWDTQDLPNGIYFYRLQTGNDFYRAGKILIQH